jgi:large subunit ribosomal protein L24
MKIKKGDNVVVISGKDKGKTGAVEQSFPKTEQVLVDGVNVKTRHQKNKRTRSAGQIVEKSAPIHVSNVALLEGKKAVRVGYKIEKDGDKLTKTRVSRASGKKI